jgi:hypothetical protein
MGGAGKSAGEHAEAGRKSGEAVEGEVKPQIHADKRRWAGKEARQRNERQGNGNQTRKYSKSMKTGGKSEMLSITQFPP